MAGWFTVGSVVPAPASAWSFWWVVVLVVRCRVQLADGYVLAARPSARLSRGPPRCSWWSPVRPHWRAPDVLVAVSLYSAVGVGHWGAAARGRPRQGSMEQPALALAPSRHARLHLSLH